MCVLPERVELGLVLGLQLRHLGLKLGGEPLLLALEGLAGLGLVLCLDGGDLDLGGKGDIKGQRV